MEPSWKDTIDSRCCANAAWISTGCRASWSRRDLKAEESMQATVFWIAAPWRGRLGILPRPRGGDWLGDEIAAWRAAGIDTVVSLLEAEEEAQLVLEGEAA